MFPQTIDFSNGQDYAKAVDLPYQTKDDLEPGQIYVANDDRFTQGSFSQPLTNFA